MIGKNWEIWGSRDTEGRNKSITFAQALETATGWTTEGSEFKSR
jgi:hypothetical protein